jgi:polysaccharide export outer membrane protein
MRFLRLRLLAGVTAVASIAAGGPAAAQIPSTRPTAEQARALLQANPQMIQQLRQKFMTSGMTRDQVHARLRAEGYPETLLDAYLPGSTSSPGAPTNELFSAIQDLGIADSSDVATLRMLAADPMSLDVFGLRDTLSTVDSLRLGLIRRRVVRADVEDSVARADSGFNVFGLDAFRSITRIAPSLLGPVSDSYKIGPGDQLVLILTGDVESSTSLNVTREGFVLIPQVGVVQVANLTLGQLTDVLYTRLGRIYSGVRRGNDATTRFSLTVTRLRTNQVYVLGEVEQAGSYLLSSMATTLNAIYAAGGPSSSGSLRQVLVKRDGKTVATVDLYDYLVRGDASKDVRLEGGDIVFVQPVGLRARVIGEVLRPGTYELKPTETLADVIALAGGFSANAGQRRVQIERTQVNAQRTADGRERTTLDIASEDLANGGGRTVNIMSGDVVRVFPVNERVRNTVRIEGNVWNPGPQGIAAGTTLSQALRLAGGPKPDTYLGQVLISRLSSDSSRTQMRAVLRDSTGAVLNDFALREDDIVQVFSLTDFRPDRYVAIGGAVKQGGRFPYRRGMTMRDLVLLGGGLREGAYLKEAEIARLPADRGGAATASTLRVPLDSTYLFERRAGERYLGAPGISAAASGAPEVELQPYDNVLILLQPSWELQRVVTISGEVSFPGQYALKTRSERLADVIDRAGGFTPEAYPEGVVFIRGQNDIGRVAIDLPQAMRRRTSPDNMLLFDADQIHVPRRSTIVSVNGAVNAPNVVAYVPGKNLRFYVNQAGGPKRAADFKRAYVTQPSGKRESTRSIWFLPDRVPKPLPGAVVVVPERDQAGRANLGLLLTALPAILTAVGTIVIAVYSTQQ